MGNLEVLSVLFVLCGLCFYPYCLGRVFKKAGVSLPIVAAFLPVVNTIVTLQVAGWSGLWLIVILALSFVPFPFGLIAAVIIAIWVSVDLAKSFGKGMGYGIALALFGFIMLPVLAFDRSAYIGPGGKVSDHTSVSSEATETQGE